MRCEVSRSVWGRSGTNYTDLSECQVFFPWILLGGSSPHLGVSTMHARISALLSAWGDPLGSPRALCVYLLSRTLSCDLRSCGLQGLSALYLKLRGSLGSAWLPLLSQPGKSCKAVSWGKCGTSLVYFPFLRYHWLSLPYASDSKTFVSYVLFGFSVVPIVRVNPVLNTPLWPEVGTLL